jgi:N-acetylmuramoyl-L-alanine amidase
MNMADCTSPRLRSAGLGILALLTAGVCSAATASPAVSKVTAVRFWSLGEVTRVAIEVSADFKYRSDRLSDPDRLFFDIRGARPVMAEKKMYTVAVGDALLKQIRIAETQPGMTRVVLDLEPHEPQVEFTASQLSNPDRLMIELRLKDKPAPPLTGSISGARTLAESPARLPEADLLRTELSKPEPSKPELSKPEPRRYRLPTPAPDQDGDEESTTTARLALKPELLALPTMAILTTPVHPPPGITALPPRALLPPPKPVETKPAVTPFPAKHNASGDQSLTRTLGLKLGRVVIDPGHGGHDVGTSGPSGLYEKDVVLDVATRLGALLEERLGSEVVYTRDDDTFIPLEERTRIANEHKADLFLSIHANSSPYRTAAGVETYYLNFTTSKTAMDLAARENASSQRSIFDLKDVLQKIAMKDKIDESREFAEHIQASLYAISSKSNAAAKDRGVKKAPFVVLIGAAMPSVLAEIGFLTNSADEALLRKPEQRQKIAEALYKGVASYADTLSHFQVAKRQ